MLVQRTSTISIFKFSILYFNFSRIISDSFHILSIVYFMLFRYYLSIYLRISIRLFLKINFNQSLRLITPHDLNFHIYSYCISKLYYIIVFVLYCIVLYCIVLYCIVLYCIAYIILYCI